MHQCITNNYDEIVNREKCVARGCAGKQEKREEVGPYVGRGSAASSVLALLYEKVDLNKKWTLEQLDGVQKANALPQQYHSIGG